MKYKLIISILICLVTSDFIQQQQAPKNEIQSHPQIRRKGQIQFLSNLLKLDALLCFIKSNKKIQVSQTKRKNNESILINRISNCENKTSSLASAQNNNGTLVQAKKGLCLICSKQFRNNSYLALHYATQHQTQHGQYQIAGSFPRKMVGFIGQTLRQPFYNAIDEQELSLLFLQSLSENQKYVYCIRLFERMQSFTQSSIYSSYYKMFDNQVAISDICTIIAFSIAQQDHWVTFTRWLSLFCTAVLALFILIYYYDANHFSDLDNAHKKERYRK